MSEYIINLDGELGMALAVACAGAGFAREEIVRCRDCEHAAHFFPWLTPSKRSSVEVWMCGLAAEGFEIEPNGFCAWGERRDV